MLLYLIGLAVGGLIIGAFARLALPGKDPLSLWQTMGVGIAGSLISGLIIYAATGGRYVGGFLAALVVSTLIMYVIRRRRGGGLTSPGTPRERT